MVDPKNEDQSNEENDLDDVAAAEESAAADATSQDVAAPDEDAPKEEPAAEDTANEEAEPEPEPEIVIGAGQERQFAIYLPGTLEGKVPSVPTRYDSLVAKAKDAMTDVAWAYIAGGAGLQETVSGNADAFGRWRIVQRMLKDVSRRDMSTEVFGMKMPAPIMFAPIGVQELVHKEGDLATAKAAGELGLPMIFSNQASVDMETCADAMGDTPRMFQLYWGKNRKLVESLVKRAEKAGCSGIVVTLDTTILGWRPWDLDLGSLPFLEGKGIAQYTSDPVFCEGLEDPAKDIGPAAMKFIQTYSNPALTWDDLAFLKGITDLPVLLKGIVHPGDAKLALKHGIDGIVVSNHGGRQVDGAVPSILALPGVVAAVKGKIPVLFDSGVRGGADIFKALALGASAVLLGRPYIYGLAIDGPEGVKDVARNMIADFDLTMGLAGCTSVKQINPKCLVSVGG